ncbi:hypothetical protein ACLOJK_011523 [Asimina triloba]
MKEASGMGHHGHGRWSLAAGRRRICDGWRDGGRCCRRERAGWSTRSSAGRKGAELLTEMGVRSSMGVDLLPLAAAIAGEMEIGGGMRLVGSWTLLVTGGSTVRLRRCSPPFVDEEGRSWICNHDVVAVLSNCSDHLIGASPVVGCVGSGIEEDAIFGFWIFMSWLSCCLRMMMGSSSACLPRHFGWLGSAVCITVGKFAAGSHGCWPW